MFSRITYNPVTREIRTVEPSRAPDTLRKLCRKDILKAVNLTRVHQIRELDGIIPKCLEDYVSSVTINDFQINIEDLGAEHHIHSYYPAKCLINGSNVILKVFPPGLADHGRHPNFISYFREREADICIYHPTESLKDRIERFSDEDLFLTDSDVWNILGKVIQEMILNKFAATTRITSENIQVMDNNELFIELPEGYDQEQIIVVPLGMPSAVYEAPEVIGRQTPTSQALSWTVGCILYEMLAMEPAFYDSSGVNPFEVFIKITQGRMPRDPEFSNAEQRDMIHRCLNIEPTERPPLQEILDMCKANYQHTMH